jgi:hypothetical protein
MLAPSVEKSHLLSSRNRDGNANASPFLARAQQGFIRVVDSQGVRDVNGIQAENGYGTYD